MTNSIPIACHLTDSELCERRTRYLDKIAAALIDTEELSNGFKYRFRIADRFIQDLAEVIDLERRCCPFLNFQMSIESGKGFVSLKLTGPAGTREMIISLFGWN
jgi:uncharacterized Fe-S cluster-containing protein